MFQHISRFRGYDGLWVGVGGATTMVDGLLNYL